jgi:RNA polymerase Rpb3/Rpb11 dimerisation domain
MQITDITVRPLLTRGHKALAPISGSLKELWPDVMVGEHCEFTISGVPTVIGNLFRVVMAGEIPVRGFSSSPEHLQTSDKHILPQFICEQRIPDIPLLQSCPLDATFTLNVVNNSASERQEVLAENLKQVRGKPGKYINSRSIICILNPGTYLNVSNITVSEDIASRLTRGNRRVAVNVASIPLDDLDADVGVANPHITKVLFSTNGTLPAKEIVLKACESILSHLDHIRGLFPGVHALPAGDTTEYTLIVTDSYVAMGAAIVKVVTQIYPDVDFIAYDYIIPERELTLRLRSKISASDVFKNVLKYIEEATITVRKSFQK